MKEKYWRLIIFVTFFLVFQNAFAQLPPPPPGAPIDGGVIALLFAGLLYGVKKIKDSKK